MEPVEENLGDFDRVCAQLRPKLYRRALHLTGSHDDAADLVQDTLINGWRGRSSFKGGNASAGS